MSKLLIGIHGISRSGKDTIANFLVDRYNFLKISQADKIKATISTMFDIPLNVFYDENIKEDKLKDWGYSPRRIAQLLGKEGSIDLFDRDIWMRHIKNVWKDMNQERKIIPDWIHQIPTMNKCHSYFDQYNGLVVPSIRYKHDIDGIKEMNGILWGVDRSDCEPLNNHASENEIDFTRCDNVFKNNSTIYDLKSNIDKLMRNILVDEDPLKAPGSYKIDIFDKNNKFKATHLSTNVLESHKLGKKLIHKTSDYFVVSHIIYNSVSKNNRYWGK